MVMIDALLKRKDYDLDNFKYPVIKEMVVFLKNVSKVDNLKKFLDVNFVIFM